VRDESSRNTFQDVGLYSKSKQNLQTVHQIPSLIPTNIKSRINFTSEPLNNNLYIPDPDDINFSISHSLVFPSIPFSPYLNMPFGNNSGSSSFLVYPFSFLPNKLINPNSPYVCFSNNSSYHNIPFEYLGRIDIPLYFDSGQTQIGSNLTTSEDHTKASSSGFDSLRLIFFFNICIYLFY
jgi:hypothetical protein